MNFRFLAIPALAALVCAPGSCAGAGGGTGATATTFVQPNETPASVSEAGALDSGISDTLRVMSFNIRYDNPGDGEDAWPNRADGVADLIRRSDADLVGLQEALPGQLADLETRLPGYAWLGTSRGGEGSKDEYSAILYRTEAVEPVDHGTFWLSETPDAPASRGWDAALPRIATWGVFRMASGGKRPAGEANEPDRGRAAAEPAILHLNTHFDHRGEHARLESARLIRAWLSEHATGRPVVVTGDLNTLPDSEPIAALTDATETGPTLVDALYASASTHIGPASTWNGFDEIVSDRRIDFVFTGKGVRVTRHEIIDARLPSGRFPSDHLPVLAEIDVPTANEPR